MIKNIQRSLKQFLGLSLGRGAEYHVLSKLLSEYREVFCPEADINGVDMIVRTKGSTNSAVKPFVEAELEKEHDASDREFLNNLITSESDYPVKDTLRKACQYEFQEIQIKSVSQGGLFAGITIKPRYNYWFVFYSWETGSMWLINSKDIENYASINAGLPQNDPGYIHASQNKKGVNIHKWSIDFTPTKKQPIKSRAFLIDDFSNLP